MNKILIQVAPSKSTWRMAFPISLLRKPPKQMKYCQIRLCVCVTINSIQEEKNQKTFSTDSFNNVVKYKIYKKN